ncbi:MAG: ParB N-terminal domain-containing protein [Patescibacteria group bacterium]|nr:ParB N-terminal domain-containing protein [Patescibacteria group bacterium]
MNKPQTQKLNIVYVPVSELKPAPYNPRTWSKEQSANLKESIKRYGLVDPLLVNSAPNRKGIVIGGHFRLAIIKELGIKEVPVVYIDIPDIEKEKNLNVRLNKNTGSFDWDLLADFDEVFLKDVGFSSEETDDIFGIDDTPEVFDLKKELAKLDIENIKVKKGEVYDLNGSRLMIGDSTIEADVLKLMGREKADMCFTDPPYILDYLKGKKKKNGDVTKGFGLKRDRVYLDTETLPDNFTELWMNNVVKIQKQDFSIIVYENPKNLKTIWTELEKHWKYRNTIIWHIPNRVQGFSAKYKFFNKHDFAIVGTSGKVGLNTDPESDELLQTEYETALFATSGSPHWESYGKGKKYCPTDFIEHIAADEKSSGQGIIFGTKPLEILIPYIKILTKRNDLIFEPYGGSGSTLIASVKMNRRCFLMEKCPTYAEVILNRWSKLTGLKPKKIL